MSIKAKHNKLIRELLVDPNYNILENGEIHNKKGESLGFVITTEITLRKKQYRYIKYKGKAIKVHRIIYAKFHGELLPRKIVHHKDGNGLNNHKDNLDQITQRENMYFKLYPEAQCDSVEPIQPPPPLESEYRNEKVE